MEKERLAAESHHNPYVETKPAFPFKAYKNKKLAALLEATFHGKCAYCESYMKAVQPQDIEHYRPKQAVLIEGSMAKPGYYWLASKWPNLLSSCIMCNRPNRHRLGSKAAQKTLGKGIQFPLESEERRARSHTADVAEEVPLILDPCGNDNPADHLGFECDGWIAPKLRADGTLSAKGAATIDVLALQRPELVKARCDRAKMIVGDLVLMEIEEKELQGGKGSRLSLACLILKIDHYLQVDQPYTEMARQIIERRKPGLLEMLPKIMTSVKSEIAEAEAMFEGATE